MGHASHKTLANPLDFCYNVLQVNSREERTTIKNNSRTRLNGEIRYPEVRESTGR